MTFKRALRLAAAAALALILGAPALAQVAVPGLPMVPLGYCQLSASALGSAVGLSSCVRASFTGSCSGSALTTSSVSGIILVGDAVSGTGVAAGTTIASQTSGTPGGAGVYVASQACTSSSASLTSGGIPPGATLAYLEAETADVRYRDDGGAPTASVGLIVVHGAGGAILYAGTLSQLQFILLSGSPLLNIGFYR